MFESVSKKFKNLLSFSFCGCWHGICRKNLRCQRSYTDFPFSCFRFRYQTRHCGRRVFVFFFVLHVCSLMLKILDAAPIQLMKIPRVFLGNQIRFRNLRRVTALPLMPWMKLTESFTFSFLFSAVLKLCFAQSCQRLVVMSSSTCKWCMNVVGALASEVFFCLFLRCTFVICLILEFFIMKTERG